MSAATFNGYPLTLDTGLSIIMTLGTFPNIVAFQIDAPAGAAFYPSATKGLDFALNDGVNGVVTFKDWTPEVGQIVQGTTVWTWTLKAKDARWRWPKKHVTGEYNRPEPDGTERHEKNIRELADLVFEALGYGRENYNLDALPTTLYPFVRWEYARCNDALDALLSEAGYAPALHRDGTVAVVKLGDGEALSDSNVLRAMDGQRMNADAFGEPKILGGQSVAEEDFALVPVGLDLDGSIVPLASLSYAPVPSMNYGGFEDWATYPPGVFDWLSDQEAECARKSVFRWWQLSAADLSRCAPLLPHRAASESLTTGEDSPLRPKVIVDDFQDFNGPLELDEVASREEVDGWTLDPERGLVMFANVRIKFDVGDSVLPALVTLTCGYLRKTEDGGLDDYCFYSYVEDRDAALESIERHPEMVLRGSYVHSTGVYTWFNQTALDAFSAARVGELRHREQLLDLAERTHDGLLPLNCDGLRHTIAWTFSIRLCQTDVSANKELMGRATPSFRVRAAQAQIAEAARQAGGARRRVFPTLILSGRPAAGGAGGGDQGQTLSTRVEQPTMLAEEP